MLLILISTLAFLSLPGSTAEFSKHMRAGNRYFTQFEDEKARDEYSKAVEIDPNHFEANMMRLRTNNSIGQILRDQNADPQKVEFYFRKNVEWAEDFAKRFPNRAEAPFSLAVAYGNLAMFSTSKEKVRLSKDVESNLKRSIQLDPNFPYAYLGLGMFYREVSQISFVERFFAKLLFGGIPKADLEMAEENFKLSLKRDPKFVFTHYHYGLCLELQQKNAEAIRQYEIALKLPRKESGDLEVKKLVEKRLAILKLDYPELFEKRSVELNEESCCSTTAN